jgi:DNA-binding transcriptional LysR family regulator
MKETIAWDELRLFLAVARASGLAGAARDTAVSAPTLGRRMNALERVLGRRLFNRRQTGYELTEAGHELYGHTVEMEAVANGVVRWRDESSRRAVRISAGSWTSRFLAQHMERLWGGDAGLAIELTTAHRRVDIVRRQADIGVRNRAPEEPRLAGRKTNDVAYAIYRAVGARDDLPWVSVTGDAAITPSARWAARHFAGRAAFLASDARVVLDCLRAGVAQAVLPCFVGDAEPAVERTGRAIPELREEQWLALNEQGRREPAVRAVIDRIVKLLTENRALFEGKRARR